MLETAAGVGERDNGAGLTDWMIGPEEDGVGEERENGGGDGEREDEGGNCGAKSGGEMWAEGTCAAGTVEGLVDGGCDGATVGAGVFVGEEPGGAGV